MKVGELSAAFDPDMEITVSAMVVDDQYPNRRYFSTQIIEATPDNDNQITIVCDVKSNCDYTDGLHRRYSEEDEIVIFKVRDYTTEMVGRRYKYRDEWIYYVQRGDGLCNEYYGYRVEWFKPLVPGAEFES
jgi:hypothetical protein